MKQNFTASMIEELWQFTASTYCRNFRAISFSEDAVQLLLKGELPNEQPNTKWSCWDSLHHKCTEAKGFEPVCCVHEHCISICWLSFQEKYWPQCHSYLWRCKLHFLNLQFLRKQPSSPCTACLRNELQIELDFKQHSVALFSFEYIFRV